LGVEDALLWIHIRDKGKQRLGSAIRREKNADKELSQNNNSLKRVNPQTTILAL